jgi:hypothetical protein
MNNYNKGSPLNKNNLDKSKNSINLKNNYNIDFNITDSNFFEDPTICKTKRSKNKKNKEKYVNNFMNTISNTDSRSKTNKITPNSQINLKKSKMKINKNSEKNKKNYLTLESMSINGNENEFEDEMNNKFQKQKKNHKRMKSCNDEENIYNKKQLMEIKKTSNKEFYNGKAKSTNKFNLLNSNSISARKIRIISKEKLSLTKLRKNNDLTINTIPKTKKNNIINQIYVNDKLKKNINSFNINLENAKNKLKDKLISVTNELRAEKLKYYTGPIDIGCISSKKIDASLNKFINKMKMNGYKYVKIKDYLFKCSKEEYSFNVELVKIKGNLIYYLVKNE